MAGSVAAMTDRSVTVFTVTIIMFALSTIFVALRMTSRAVIVKKISLDDYIMMLAWLLAFGLTFSICYGATVGLGRHQDNVPESWLVPLKDSEYAFSLLYQPALMAQKSSILVFFLTLSKSNKIFRYATIATLTGVLAAGLGITLFTAFQCRPPAAAYALVVPASAHCTNVVTIYLSSSPINIISDLALLILPMPILIGMRLPRKQKIILIITFSFGLFVAVVDVVRVAYLQSASTYFASELDGTATSGSNAATDFSWYAAYSYMWTAIEVDVGIMCACVPGLKPLVARFAPHLIHSTDSETTVKTLSQENTADMIQRQRLPSLAPGGPVPQFHSHDFASQTDASSRRPPSSQPPEMNMMQFLTMSASNDAPRQPSWPSEQLFRSDTLVTNASTAVPPETSRFFDFVDMSRKKSMVYMTNRESLFPNIMVTVLFFIWGFEYGLLDALNQQFQTVANMSAGQSVALHSAYYAGYFLGPLTAGRFTLKTWGFKACYNVGLAVYACGTLIFWVAAVLTSFPCYVVVNFIVGFGLSILETGANPFISLCGPPQYAEIRLNLSQGFQAIGTVIAPLIAAKALTKYTDDNAPSLIHTQWAYLGIAFFTVILAFAYHYVPLPEATDAELEEAAERMDHANDAKIGSTRVIWFTLGLGVLSQFCYVGAQEVYATTFDADMTIVEPTFDTTNFLAIAHTAFALSRFAAAGLGFIFKPRVLLLFFFLGAVVFSALSTHYSGDTAVAMLIMVFFFEGPIFSLIYAQCLRGLGRHTKDGTCLLTAAISGGAVFPAISYVAQTRRGPAYAFVVAIAAFATGALLPAVVSVVPKFRLLLDPIAPGASEPQSPTGSIFARPLPMFKKERGSKDGSADFRERHESLAPTTPTTEA